MSPHTPTTSSAPFNPSKEQTHFDSAPSSHLHDYFNKQAKEYEAKAGDVTRSIARKAVGYLGELGPDAKVHDNASGPAIFASELLKAHPGAHVTCTDNAQGMVDVIEKLAKETPGWEGHVEATLMSGETLSFPSSTFDASVTNFGIFMMNTPEAAAAEIYRTLKPGGKAVVSSWRSAGWPSLLRAIQLTNFPTSPPFSSPLQERWNKSSTLVSCLQAGGFSANNIEIHEVETAIWGQVSEWESWMKSYVGVIGSMVGEGVSKEVKEGLEEGLRGLWMERREEFFVRGEEGSGRFGVRMVAWVGVARK